MTTPRSGLAGILAVLGLVLLGGGCGGAGKDAPSAAPTFCPTALASRLQASAGANSPPSAYYQSLSVRAETSLAVTLLACDPDQPSTSDGLTWSVIPDPASSPAGIPGPSYGTLSAMAGTYPDAVITYDPAGGFSGSDAFWYEVVDAHGATSNSARILIDILPVPVSLVVSGPSSAVENTTITFTATASWIGTSPSDVTASALWTEDSAYASFGAPGVLDMGLVPSDQTVTVTAVFAANGSSVSDTLVIAVANVNHPPLANAASYGTSEDTVFNGALSLLTTDPDGDPLVYSIVTDGALGVAYMPDNTTGLFSYLPYADVFGTDRFVFQAFDGADWSNTAGVTVTIHPVNDLPSPSIAGTGSADEGAVVIFTGTINDPDGPSPFSYTFAFGDGGSISGTTSGNAVAGNHRYLRDQYSPPYTVTLTVSDALGASASAIRSIQILNVAPSVTIAGPASAQTGSPVLFSAVVSDPADTVFTYRWDFEDDGTYDSTLASPTHAFTAASVYTVRLQVGDGTGWGTDTLTVTVTGSPVNLPPVVSIDNAPFSLTEGEEGFYTGSYTDPDGPAPWATYWDWGDGTATENALSPGHRFLDGPADYTVVLRVTDALGAAGTDSVVVGVSNAAPVAVAAADTLNTTTGTAVHFDGSGSSDAGNDVLSYTWIFGDGDSTTASLSPLASHAYAASGIYTASLRVTDGDGGFGTDALDVTVGGGGEAAGAFLYIWGLGKVLSFEPSSGQVTTLEGTAGWWSNDPILFSRGFVQYHDGFFYYSGPSAVAGTASDLWRIGPGGGATRITNVDNFIREGLSPSDLTVYEGKLYLAGYDSGSTRQLWSFDQNSVIPTLNLAAYLTTLAEGGSPVWPMAVTPYRGKLAFSGLDALSNFQLRSYDPVTGFAFLTSEPASLDPVGTLVFKDLLCFNGPDPLGGSGELWCHDPASGPVMLTDAANGINPLEFEVLDGKLYFVGGETYPAMQLWAYDGSNAPAVAWSVSGAIWPVGMAALDGRLYFMGSDPSGYNQVLSYDPGNPAAGAVPVTSFATGFAIGDGTRMVVHDGRLYFSGAGVTEGVPSLWSYNGEEGLVARRTGITWSLIDAMGLDPAVLPSTDISGTWTIETITGPNTCLDPEGVVSYSRAAITQRGGDVTADIADTAGGTMVTWNAFMRGSTVQSRPRTYPDGVGFTTESFMVAGNSMGTAFSGGTTWTWTDGTFNCGGTCTLKGSKDIAGAWLAPEVGPDAVVNPLISAPDAAVDGSGNGMVVWSDDPDGGYVNALSLAGRVYVEQNRPRTPSPAAFGLAQDGSGLAVWQGSSLIDTAAPVRCALFDGNAWGPATTLATPARASTMDGPVLDVTPGGNAIAMWRAAGVIGDALKLGWFDGGTATWGTTMIPPVLLPPGTAKAYPSVAALSETVGYGLYPVAAGYQVGIVYRNPMGLWEQGTLPFNGLASVREIAADAAAGIAAAAWSDLNGNEVYVWVAGNFPSTLGTVYTTGSNGYARNIQVKVDANSLVTVAWDNQAGDVFTWRQSRLPDGSIVWYHPPWGLNSGSFWAERPSLAADASGRLVVLWVQGRDGAASQLYDVYSAWNSPDGWPWTPVGWSLPIPVRTAVDETVVSPIGVGFDGGRAWAAWVTTDSVNGNHDMWFTRSR